MESLHESPSTVEQALAFHRRGLRLVPLRGKTPLVRNWPFLELGEADVRTWAQRCVNWGALTGDPLIVLDTDTEAAERWVQDRGITSSVMVRSGRGGLHRWFRKPDTVTVIRSSNGMHGIPGLDVKAWHGCIVLPGSVHPNTGNEYVFLPGKDLHELGGLPPFDPKWVAARHEPSQRLPTLEVHPNSLGQHIRNVRAYIRAIPSVQGQNGSRALMRVCYLLVEEGFSAGEALAEVTAWNDVAAFPPWSPRELVRAVTNAFQRKLHGNLAGTATKTDSNRQSLEVACNCSGPLSPHVGSAS